MAGAKDSAQSEDKEVCVKPHMFLFYPSSGRWCHFRAQNNNNKIHSISSLDLLFPNIFLICHDLKDFFFIAIQISFVSPLVLPEAGLLLLITHFVYQMPFYETCCALAEFFFLPWGLGSPSNASLASFLLDLLGRIWLPKLGFHSCGLKGFLSAHTKGASTQHQLHVPFKASQLEQLLRFEVVLLTSLANW